MIIEGIASGDLECWCFLVDLKTFKKVTGEKPGKWDVGRFAKKGSPYRYMLYPNHLVGFEKDGKLIEIKIEVRHKE